MRIVAQYSFCRGAELITRNHPAELREVTSAIQSVDAEQARTKQSKEKTMPGRLLYAPIVINAAILDGFLYKPPYSWDTPHRKLPISYAIPGIGTKTVTFTTDGVKNRVALEIQLGKYAFAEYDICAKLPTYKKFGRIECAIEVLPMNSFSRQMSTGPGWFERTATILENRGYGDLDVPVLLLGIDS
jgi:hypothetical protein